jgi:hypothetical protein
MGIFLIFLFALFAIGQISESNKKLAEIKKAKALEPKRNYAEEIANLNNN